MPTDEEAAQLRERDRVELSLSPEEVEEERAPTLGGEARSAVSAGCVGYAFALLLTIAGVVVMVSSQPVAVLLIAVAVGIGFWSHSKLKQAEPHVR